MLMLLETMCMTLEYSYYWGFCWEACVLAGEDLLWLQLSLLPDALFEWSYLELAWRFAYSFLFDDSSLLVPYRYIFYIKRTKLKTWLTKMFWLVLKDESLLGYQTTIEHEKQHLFPAFANHLRNSTFCNLDFFHLWICQEFHYYNLQILFLQLYQTKDKTF